MNIEFFQYSNDYLRKNVDPSDMWCFTYGKTENDDYYIPIDLLEDSRTKFKVALAEGVSPQIFMGKVYFNTKWLSERFEDTRPYINKLYEMDRTAQCLN